MRIVETADDVVYERKRDVPIRPLAAERILTCLVDRLVRGEQFKLLSAIVETKSFSKAASALGVTQPSVSQNVKRLETILGRPLFRRSSKGAELTAHGEAVIMYVRVVQALTENLQRYFDHTAGDFSVSKAACRSAARRRLE